MQNEFKMAISETKFNLILTLDYELFGDGSGNVFSHMIEPTKYVLRLCEEYGIRLTLFFEATEYLKIKEEWNRGNKMGYKMDPIVAIENQIQDAAKNGHDIQLHIHPQWENAKYLNGKWKVDFNNWRLGDFESGNIDSIKSLLKNGKETLENLIRKVVPEYECIAFRAGGYNITPSNHIYQAMKELDFKIDSSIFPGGYKLGNLSKFDYREVALNLDFWWADEIDMRKKSISQKEIIEIPIFALSIHRWKKYFTFSKIIHMLNFKNVYVGSVIKEEMKEKTFVEKIMNLAGKETFTWDFCMFSNFRHKTFFKFIENYDTNSRNTFVLIGHPKNLTDKKLFRNFLKMAHSRKHPYLFKTLSEKYEEFVKKPLTSPIE